MQYLFDLNVDYLKKILMNQINFIFIQTEAINNPSVCPANSKMVNLVGMSDTVIRPVIVEPEGTTRDYTVSARNYRIYNSLVGDFVCKTYTNSSEYYLPLVKI